jgi:hypothetical protein
MVRTPMLNAAIEIPRMGLVNLRNNLNARLNMDIIIIINSISYLNIGKID